jgi:hypothetical protein
VSGRYFEPLKHRDFALLWSGQAVSQLGDGIFTVTLAIETLRLDHHATGLSYVLAARLLPAVLFTLAGGVLVDRVPRRLVMLASDVARGAAVAVITVLVATGEIITAAAESALESGEVQRRRTLARLRRELRRVGSRDYFPPPERDGARAAVERLAPASVEVAR